MIYSPNKVSLDHGSEDPLRGRHGIARIQSAPPTPRSEQDVVLVRGKLLTLRQR